MDILKSKIKTDCFAFEYGRMYPGCRILKELVCLKEKCGFYKSRRQYEKDLEKYPHQYEVKRREEQALKDGVGNGEKV